MTSLGGQKGMMVTPKNAELLNLFIYQNFPLISVTYKKVFSTSSFL